MARSPGGAREDVRASALWGTSNRGGEHRSNALWGRGGRGLVTAVTAVIAVVALTLPLAAAAGDGPGKKAGTGGGADYVHPGLLEGAAKDPEKVVRLIVSSKDGASIAEGELKKLFKGASTAELKQRLDLVDGVVVELRASWLKQLAKIPGLVIVPDSPVVASGGMWNKQLWPYESGNARLWGEDTWTYRGKSPTIAIVDSGVEPGRGDYASRLIADVKLTSIADGPGDSRGHGTFVAGIAAGSASGYAGAAPTAKLLSIDVMNDRGMAMTSDVIRACEWILANKNTYNIRVANFSLHSSFAGSLRWNPLNKAVEKLWFSGVVVVAAAGNYGRADGPSGVPHAPGNDPFVITVGAVDLEGTASVRDDTIAYWSAYGYTPDGFAKPEVAAAGRYMVGPVPKDSSLATERSDQVVEPGYIQLSGTSFAAPVVAGTVAQMLTRHPRWTPDQVKGALMLTTRAVGEAGPLQAGVGQITATRAADVELTNPPNPNLALNRFVVPDPNGGSIPAFDAAGWADAAWANAGWASASYDDAGWANASWDTAGWANAAWASTSFDDAAWADAGWADAGWADHKDVAEGDVNAEGGYPLTPEEEAAVESDPLLQLQVGGVGVSIG